MIDDIPQSNPDWDIEKADPASSSAPYILYNIGNSAPVELLDYIKAIEKAVGKKAKKEFLLTQPGDVLDTYSDMTDMMRQFNYKPCTLIEEGVKKFVDGYTDYYRRNEY